MFAAAATAAKYGFILARNELTENGLTAADESKSLAPPSAVIDGDVLVEASDGMDCGVLSVCGQRY